MERIFFAKIAILAVLGFILATSYILSENAIALRDQGPLVFLFHLYPITAVIGVTLSIIFYMLLYRVGRMESFSSYFFIIGLVLFAFKLVIPFMFFRVVNYDSPGHYVSAAYLRDYGIDPSLYSYHNWPAMLYLTIIFENVTALFYPNSCNLIAITSRFLLPLIIYVYARHIMGTNGAIFAFLVLLISEPYIVHYCPQILGVTLLVITIFVFVMRVGIKKETSLLVFIIGWTLLLCHSVLSFSLVMSLIALTVFFRILLHYLNKSESNKRFLVLAKRIASRFSTVLFLACSLLLYNTYITLSVTRSVVKTLKNLFVGVETRWDVYAITELSWQYNLLTLFYQLTFYPLYYASFVILGTFLCIKLLKRRITSSDAYLISILVIIAVNHALNFAGNVVFELGIVERFHQVAIIFSSIMVGGGYIYFLKNADSISKSLARLLKCLFLFMLITTSFLSFYSTPYYKTQYISSLDTATVFQSSFVGEYLSNSIYWKLDGDQRVNELIMQQLYPKMLWGKDFSITRIMDEDALFNLYKYPPNTLIILNNFSYIKPVTINGLTDEMLKKYICALQDHFPVIYDNKYGEIFIN